MMSNDLISCQRRLDRCGGGGAHALRGTLLRFHDWNWTVGKEASPVEKGKRLVATGTTSAWVKWANGKPTEYRMKPAGKPMPNRETLGDTDEAQWEKGPDGKPRDPWQSSRFVYLLDPDTAEAFTFSTSSFGGREAVINLGDAIARMRTAHPHALPVVELQAAAMPTRFGRKSKPIFKIMDWKTVGAGVWDAPQLPPELEENYEP
jgi:hypothetical protein